MASNGNNQASSSSNHLDYLPEMLPKMSKAKQNKYVSQVQANHEKATTKAKNQHEQQQQEGPRVRMRLSAGIRPYGQAEDVPITCVGEIRFTFALVYKTHPDDTFQQTIDLTWNSNRHPTAEEIDQYCDELQKNLSDQSEILTATELSDFRRVETRDVDADAPAPDKRMAKEQEPLLLNGFDNSYDTGRGRCTIDFVRHVFGKDNKMMCSQDKYIAAVMTGAMGTRSSDRRDYILPTLGNFNRVAEAKTFAIRSIFHEGACGDHLVNVARYLGSTMACLDEDNNIVSSHCPDFRNHRRMLVFHIRNNHIYPVTEPSFLKSVSQRLVTAAYNPRTALEHNDGSHKADDKKVTSKLRNVTGLCSHGRQQQLVKEIVDRGWELPMKTTMGRDGSIQRHVYRDKIGEETVQTTTTFNDDERVANLTLRRMGKEEREDATIGTILHELTTKHLKDMKKSRPNPVAEQWLTTMNALNNVHHGTLAEPTSRSALYKDFLRDLVHCFDLKGAYPACMYRPASEWALFDHNATPQPYDGTAVSDLKLGLYYVETEDRVVLNGTRVYIREELVYAAEKVVPFKIKSMLLATSSLPKDTFHGFMQDVVRLTRPFDMPEGYDDVDEDVLTATRKKLLVMMYGMLGKSTDTKVGTVHISKQVSDVWGYALSQLQRKPNQEIVHKVLQAPAAPLPIFWAQDEEDEGERPDQSQPELHMYAMKTSESMLEHNIGMSIQIQGFNNVNLNLMWERLGGIPLAVKTDALILRNCQHPKAVPRDAISPEDLPGMDDDSRTDRHMREVIAAWGTYKRIERFEEFFAFTDLRACDMLAVQHESVPWTDHPEITDSAQFVAVLAIAMKSRGALINSRAGCGKSWMAKEIMKIAVDAVLLAPTHKASNNLGGCTIHSWVGAKYSTVTKRRGELQKTMARYPAGTVIIVDEAFMCGEFLFYCLYVIHRIRPDLVWILLGDKWQLGPVEDSNDYDYEQHPTLKHLAGHQRIVLTKSYRCSDELVTISNRVYDQSGFKMRDHFPHSESLQKLNMAWTNVAVFYINDLCMQRWRPQDAIEINEDMYDDRTQDVWLYVGLPVISCKTTKLGNKSDMCLPEKPSIQDTIRAAVDMQNNESHEVARVDADGSKFVTRSKRDGKERDWDVADFHSFFRVAYCITVHKAQGDTVEEDFTIWEGDRMPKNMQYTAITRAKQAQQITLARLPNDLGTAAKRREKRIRKALKAKLVGYAGQDRARGHDVCDIDVDHFQELLTECGTACFHCQRTVKLSGYVKRDVEQVTLDRIDNSKGHIHGNVRVACQECNVSHDHEEEAC